MSSEEKIEAAQKLIDEARTEIAAKKRNWLEEAKPGMLFRSNGKVVAIPPRFPVNHAISLDPERIGMRCYGWESAPDIEYLGHARDILTIALPPQVIEAHEPTGAELVGRVCVYTNDDGRMNNAGQTCEVYEPGRGYSWGSRRMWYKHARLAR